FKLPNFFRRLFAEGAFAAAFVPLFAKALGRGTDVAGRTRARAFAEDALAVLLLVLLLFTALVEALMPWAMVVLAPGFLDEPEKFALAIDLTRLTFPYLLLISLVALFSGILNALGRFAAAAAAPILLNLVLIAAILGFHESDVAAARALAMAVSVAGIVQFLWLALAARRAGFALRLPRPRLTPGVRRLLRVMLPVAIGAGVMQVNLVFDVILASFLPQGSLSFLFYADRLNQLPLGVIGIAVGTVLLPRLSRALAGGHADEVQGSHNRAIEFALLLTLPAAVALAIIPAPLIRALFEHGAFSASDTEMTARALTAFALGLPAFVLVKVLAPGFFAREDTRTPVVYGLVAMGANILFSLLLIWSLAHVGLALATTMSAWLNVTLLGGTLIRRGDLVPDRRLLSRGLRMILASAGMGVLLWFADGLLTDMLPDSRGTWIGHAALLVLLGLLGYGILALGLRALRPADLRAALERP
ncbi:MAG: murein biosynthesis integral membrane protein MurJ, partial [Alphaproteobacteria bacterium]